MKKTVLDCDNTFRIKNCGVDDGSALMYLLGGRETEFLGITSTYGNSNLDVVQAMNLRILEELERGDIPAKKGGEKRGCYQSEAVGLLVETADRHPGELSILATGSLIDLRGAYKKDRYFFGKVKGTALMDGVTSPLTLDKKVVGELNFSCDPPVTRTALTRGRNVSIMTSNNCLKVLLTKREYREWLSGKESRATAYTMKKTDYWFGYNDRDHGIPGPYNWDVTIAVHLMHPELFEDDVKCLWVSGQDLGTGYLGMDSDGMQDGTAIGKKGEGCTCNLPVIRESEVLKDSVYETWLSMPGIRTGVYR